MKIAKQKKGKRKSKPMSNEDEKNTIYQLKQTQNWNQIEKSQETKNPIKSAYKKKGKRNLIIEISWFFFAIALTTKEEEENMEICKEKKTKTKKLNPEQPTTTNQQNSTNNWSG